MNMHNPPHPGELIAETLDELNVSVREFSRALHIAPSTAQRIVTGKMAVTPEMAVKLAAVLGSSAEYWLKLQANRSLWIAEQTVDTSGLHRLVMTLKPA